MKKPPIYCIEQFQDFQLDRSFYANNFTKHLEAHHFISKPHKHDFYMVVLFTQGYGKHQIDFTEYAIMPGSIFLLKPGQVHNWRFSRNIEGYIFFHTKEFYELTYSHKKTADYPFFYLNQNTPAIYSKSAKIKGLFEEILEEHRGEGLFKQQKLCSLIDVLYIELSRMYYPQQAEADSKNHYFNQLMEFEQLIELHFSQQKLPKTYAEKMCITTKQLNRISQATLHKPASEVIAQRIILEAKRLLVQGNLSMAEVALELGYEDPAYFSRFFKRKCGLTPKAFQQEVLAKWI
ncbi:helix-turn-helix domain-containing protein [Rapidithrix thailandica]|uniref:Helix-turn-helix domain-containing protein n=1 Tax=Rapidithrix thailandica TaxID=413964 RepID=A0AAW9SAN5_9BACT